MMTATAPHQVRVLLVIDPLAAHPSALRLQLMRAQLTADDVERIHLLQLQLTGLLQLLAKIINFSSFMCSISISFARDNPS